MKEYVPKILGALVRRYGDFDGAEDAVQEALIAASEQWPRTGEPDDPEAWLIRVASRRLANKYRADDARRRREELAASWSIHTEPDPVAEEDDTLLLMVLCCHPALTPGAAIPLTLRAVGGLSTREIATLFLLPEATMAQRISRAKVKVRDQAEPFVRPSPTDLPERLRSVRRALYLLYTEGHTTSDGAELGRVDVATEAIRLARMLVEGAPHDAESSALLALMLLSEARRPARTTTTGALVPLAEQDRTRWDRAMITEGLLLVTDALRAGDAGEYTILASINALHAEAPSHDATRWVDIATLYERLETLTGNPMVRLNRAVAVAMADGPRAGLAMLEGDLGLGDHHRVLGVRAHLHELAGDRDRAADEYAAAAARTANQRERDYLLLRAARVRSYGVAP